MADENGANVNNGWPLPGDPVAIDQQFPLLEPTDGSHLAGDQLEMIETGADYDISYPLPRLRRAEYERWGIESDHDRSPLEDHRYLDGSSPDFFENLHSHFGNFDGSLAGSLALSGIGGSASDLFNRSAPDLLSETLVADVPALLAGLPASWNLASSLGSSLPSATTSGPDTASAYETSSESYSAGLNGLVAAPAANAIPSVFDSHPLTEDAFLTQITSDIAQAIVKDTAPVASLSASPEREEDALDPALRSDGLRIGEDETGSADEFGAIETGAPTGAIASLDDVPLGATSTTPLSVLGRSEEAEPKAFASPPSTPTESAANVDEPSVASSVGTETVPEREPSSSVRELSSGTEDDAAAAPESPATGAEVDPVINEPAVPDVVAAVVEPAVTPAVDAAPAPVAPVETDVAPTVTEAVVDPVTVAEQPNDPTTAPINPVAEEPSQSGDGVTDPETDPQASGTDGGASEDADVVGTLSDDGATADGSVHTAADADTESDTVASAAEDATAVAADTEEAAGTTDYGDSGGLMYPAAGPGVDPAVADAVLDHLENRADAAATDSEPTADYDEVLDLPAASEPGLESAEDLSDAQPAEPEEWADQSSDAGDDWGAA